MIWAEAYSPDTQPPGSVAIPSLGADWYGLWTTGAAAAQWCSAGVGRVRGSTYERTNPSLPDYALAAAVGILDATSVQGLSDAELRSLAWHIMSTEYTTARALVYRAEIERRGLHNG